MKKEEKFIRNREIDFLMNIMEYIGFSRGRSNDDELAEEGSTLRGEVKIRLMKELGCLTIEEQKKFGLEE
jgi:hypothetical protein